MSAASSPNNIANDSGFSAARRGFSGSIPLYLGACGTPAGVPSIWVTLK